MKTENYEIPVIAAPRDLSVYNRGEYKGFPKHVRERFEEHSHLSVPLDPDRISGKI